MEREDVKQLAEEVSSQTAEKMAARLFERLDIDIDDPEQMRELRDDLRFAREIRESGNKVGHFALRTTVVVMTGATLIAIWRGVVFAAAQITGGSP